MPRHQKRAKNSKLTNFVDCIKGTQAVYDWHPNKDPIIYVSFSARALLKTYGHLAHVRLMLKYNPLMELNRESEAEVKTFINAEFEKWGVRFVDAEEKNLSGKNVVFLMHKDPQAEDQNGLTISHPNESENKFKLIFMPSFSSNKLTNEKKYVYLHELMHAVAGAKHPILRVEIDPPPHCPSVTCEDTVLSYVPEDCPKVRDKIDKLLGPKKISAKTTDPQEQTILTKIYKEFPSTLRELDTRLLSAEQEKRKKNVGPQQKNKKSTASPRTDLFRQPTSFGGQHSSEKSAEQTTFLTRCCNLPVRFGNYLIDCFLSIAKEAVEVGGPHYGPQKMPCDIMNSERLGFFDSQTQCYYSAPTLPTNSTHALK